MGLHRFFTLTAEHKNGDAITPEEALILGNEVNGYECGWCGMLDEGALDLEDANWYDWEEDMRAIAADHPDLLFTLLCAGESLDDTWCAGFCGNRINIQGAEIPPLDMEYLKGK